MMIEDRLEKMMQEQEGLQRRINGYDLKDQTDYDRIENIKLCILALTSELHEALSEVGWKPWATSNHINYPALKSELIDAWHFMMNLFLHAGMTAEEVFELYQEKRLKNIQRQEQGYDGVSGKCPLCKRDYNDVGVNCQPATASVTAHCASFNADRGVKDDLKKCPGCKRDYKDTGVECTPNHPASRNGATEKWCKIYGLISITYDKYSVKGY